MVEYGRYYENEVAIVPIDQNILMNLSMIIPVGLMFVVMILSQKRKSKREQELRDSVKVGDEVTTIGGIVGVVISVREDSIVIESQSERLRIKKWSIGAVNKGA